MHSNFYFSKTVEAYNYDYTSDHAILAIAFVNYWATHAFKLANWNGFYFNTCPLGLSPNGMLHLSMILYDPCMASYVHNNEDICLFTDIDVQILYFLFTLMDTVQPNLHFTHDCFLTSCNCVPQTIFLLYSCFVPHVITMYYFYILHSSILHFIHLFLIFVLVKMLTIFT